MMFRVVDGCFRYPRSSAPLLTGINVSLAHHQLLAILGPNGAGKTTLVRAMIGLLAWTSGRTEIDGVDLTAMTPLQIGRTVAYVPQARAAMSLSLTGLDMVTLGRAPHLGLFTQPGPRERALAQEAMASIGIAHLAEMPCGTMSGGQFQMILIARALVAEPRVIILDEPETGLDFHNQLVVLTVLRRLVEERDLTVIMNTHYPAHALRVADQVLLIDAQHRPRSGPTAELMTEAALGDVFDVEVRITDIDHRGQPVPTVTAMDLRR